MSKGVIEEGNIDFLKAVEPDTALLDVATGVIIEEKAHVIEEQAPLTVCSNKCRDPTQPDYNMSIPPATYNEVI